MDVKMQEIDISKFVKGTMVVCRYADGLSYEARITKVANVDGVRHFSIHYSQGKPLIDETIPEADARYRFQEHSDEVVERYQKIRNEMLAMSARKSTAGTSSGAEASKPSDASTPVDKSKTEQEETTTESPPAKTVIKPIDVSKITKDTMVMCWYPDRIYYKAHITDVKEVDGVRLISIHYPRWDKSFDETLTETEARCRLVEHSAEIAEHFKNIRTARLAVSSGKSTASTPSGRSRVSTPADQKTPRAASRPSTSAMTTPVAKQPQSGTSERGPNNEAPAFTAPLLSLIDKDEDLITRRNKLAKVPARHTVKMIIDEYVASIGKVDEQMDIAWDQYGDDMILPDATIEDQKEYAESLLEYFDASIGSHSLYPVESSQFVTLYEQEVAKLPPESSNKACKDNAQPTGIRLSGQYGVIHLLRMLIRFGKILAFTPWVDNEGMMKQAQDLLLFLHTRLPEYYDEELDYDDATEEYAKSVPDGIAKRLRILGVKQ